MECETSLILEIEIPIHLPTRVVGAGPLARAPVQVVQAGWGRILCASGTDWPPPNEPTIFIGPEDLHRKINGDGFSMRFQFEHDRGQRAVTQLVEVPSVWNNQLFQPRQIMTVSPVQLLEKPDLLVVELVHESGRFKTVSILTTAVQEGFVARVCNPAADPERGGVELSRLLPEGVDDGDATAVPGDR